MAESGNIREKGALGALAARLPPGWSVDRASAKRPDAAVRAPDGRTLNVELKWARRLEPREAAELGRRREFLKDDLPVIIVSDFLSPRARKELDAARVSYIDLTGNARIVFSKPGLFIETTGASRDPRREERPARSLKGDKASRVIRELVDSAEILGVRALAVRAGVNPGYVSRVFTLLDKEALIERDRGGRATSMKWDEVLRRWAEDAPLSSRGESASFIDPRGLEHAIDRLQKSRMRHAITGSLAAARIAPVAPPRLAVVYVENLGEAARRLGLREADAGSNVQLVEPRDRFVFTRSTQLDGLVYAATSQVAADLLSSPGRGPVEAEALISWMKAHEEAWRG